MDEKVAGIATTVALPRLLPFLSKFHLNVKKSFLVVKYIEETPYKGEDSLFLADFKISHGEVDWFSCTLQKTGLISFSLTFLLLLWAALLAYFQVESLFGLPCLGCKNPDCTWQQSDIRNSNPLLFSSGLSGFLQPNHENPIFHNIV